MEKDEAVAGLRSALLAGAGVADALRACWYGHPLFASALLGESVRLRFDRDADIRLVTRFVSRIRQSRRIDDSGSPSREAEAVVRACLGEVELLEAVDPSVFSYQELGIAICTRLFEEWQPGRAEVESLLGQVESALLAMSEVSPVLQAQEDAWFAAGMHLSPFALPWDGQ